MGSNADGNTAAVKCETWPSPLCVVWKRDEQCCLVTLLTACCSCMGCKLWLEMDQNRSFVGLSCCTQYSLINILYYAQCWHCETVGMGTKAVRMGRVLMVIGLLSFCCGADLSIFTIKHIWQVVTFATNLWCLYYHWFLTVFAWFLPFFFFLTFCQK